MNKPPRNLFRLASPSWAVLGCVLTLSLAASDSTPVATPLSQLDPISAHQSWGQLATDQSVWGKPMQIGNRKFATGLVAHEADSRGGLAWMTRRYAEFFHPPNPRAHEIAGLGAYSDWEGDLAHVQCEAFHPGGEAPVPLPATFKDGELRLRVPLKRGCAMVKLVTETQFAHDPTAGTWLPMAASARASADSTTSAADDFLNFPHHQPYVEVEWRVREKTPDPMPEGGWLCFPFAVAQPRFLLGRLGGPIDPAKDIVAGANRHYFCLNTGLTITGRNGEGIGLCPLDLRSTPLGEPLRIRDGRITVPVKSFAPLSLQLAIEE